MDLRWLTAEEQQLEAAIAKLDEDERPDVEGRSFLRAGIAYVLLLVNDVDIEPLHRATFVSLITGDRLTAMCRPRYAAPGVEFGNLTSRTHSHLDWHYLATELPAPLPHLILESTAAGPLPQELARAEIGQSLSLGHPFDHHFTLHARAVTSATRCTCSRPR